MPYRQPHVLYCIGYRGDDGVEMPVVMLFGREDAQSGMVALYIHHIINVDGLAVDVCRAVGSPFDDETVGPEGVDDGVFVDEAGHQVRAGYHGAQSRAAVDYCHVKEPVGQGRMRSYVGVVAILRGIAHGHEESFVGHYGTVGPDGVDLWPVADIFSYGAAYVAEFAPSVLTCKPPADLGIESYTEGTEKRLAVDLCIVAYEMSATAYDGQSVIYVDGYAEMAGKPVAGAAWYYAEACPGVAKGGCGLVDSAVATGSQHGMESAPDCILGQPCRIAVAGGVCDFDAPACMGQSRQSVFGKTFLAGHT